MSRLAVGVFKLFIKLGAVKGGKVKILCLVHYLKLDVPYYLLARYSRNEGVKTRGEVFKYSENEHKYSEQHCGRGEKLYLFVYLDDLLKLIENVLGYYRTDYGYDSAEYRYQQQGDKYPMSRFPDHLEDIDKALEKAAKLMADSGIILEGRQLLGNFDGMKLFRFTLPQDYPEKVAERLTVGKITDVDVSPIVDLLEKGYIPVISTVGCDKQGNVYNINADTAAAYIAGKMNAERLIAMTDIEGILRDKDDPKSLIPLIDLKDAEKAYKEKGTPLRTKRMKRTA